MSSLTEENQKEIQIAYSSELHNHSNKLHSLQNIPELLKLKQNMELSQSKRSSQSQNDFYDQQQILLLSKEDTNTIPDQPEQEEREDYEDNLNTDINNNLPSYKKQQLLQETNKLKTISEEQVQTIDNVPIRNQTSIIKQIEISDNTNNENNNNSKEEILNEKDLVIEHNIIDDDNQYLNKTDRGYYHLNKYNNNNFASSQIDSNNVSKNNNASYREKLKEKKLLFPNFSLSQCPNRSRTPIIETYHDNYFQPSNIQSNQKFHYHVSSTEPNCPIISGDNVTNDVFITDPNDIKMMNDWTPLYTESSMLDKCKEHKKMHNKNKEQNDINKQSDYYDYMCGTESNLYTDVVQRTGTILNNAQHNKTNASNSKPIIPEEKDIIYPPSYYANNCSNNNNIHNNAMKLPIGGLSQSRTNFIYSSIYGTRVTTENNNIYPTFRANTVNTEETMKNYKNTNEYNNTTNKKQGNKSDKKLNLTKSSNVTHNNSSIYYNNKCKSNETTSIDYNTINQYPYYKKINHDDVNEKFNLHFNYDSKNVLNQINNNIKTKTDTTSKPHNISNTKTQNVTNKKQLPNKTKFNYKTPFQSQNNSLVLPEQIYKNNYKNFQMDITPYYEAIKDKQISYTDIYPGAKLPKTTINQNRMIIDPIDSDLYIKLRLKEIEMNNNDQEKFTMSQNKKIKMTPEMVLIDEMLKKQSKQEILNLYNETFKKVEYVPQQYQKYSKEKEETSDEEPNHNMNNNDYEDMHNISKYSVDEQQSKLALNRFDLENIESRNIINNNLNSLESHDLVVQEVEDDFSQGQYHTYKKKIVKNIKTIS